MVTLFHNPNCSTSRAALAELDAATVEFETIEYLKTPLERADLERIIAKLDVDRPSDLVRRDKFFTEVVIGDGGFDPETLNDPAAVIDLLLIHPRLLQRPIIESETRAFIGRPKDRVPAFLADQA